MIYITCMFLKITCTEQNPEIYQVAENRHFLDNYFLILSIEF